MDLFRYLMVKNGHNYLKDDDLFSYKLAKGQGGTYAIFTGTTISATNTRRGKMKVNLLGNTSQTGTPTPETPIPVNIVSGDNTINVTGKNLLNVNKGEDNYGITFTYDSANQEFTLNGTLIQAGNLTLSHSDLGIAEGQQISISVFHTGGTATIPSGEGSAYAYALFSQDYSKYIRGATSNTTFIDTYTFTGNMIQKSGGNDDCLLLQLWRTGITFNNYKIKIQIEKGSPTPYEPYTSTSYPIHLEDIELCKIGEYQDYFTKNSGKNLWDEEMEAGGYDLSTGAKENTTYYRSANYIPVKPNTNYSLYKPVGMYTRILFYDSSKTFISAPDVIYTNRVISSFASPNNAYYMTFQISYGSATYNNNIMLVEGTYTSETMPPYEPYGNGDWYLRKAIGKVVLDGSGGWSTDSSGKLLFTTIADMIFNSSSTYSETKMYSNYFEDIKSLSGARNDTSGNAMFCYSSNIYINGTLFNFDSATLNTWLSTHNTSVYYQLATPTYTPITGTLKDELEALQKAQSYKGTTNINQINNDLAANMEASILVNE